MTHGFAPGAWRIVCGPGAPQMKPLGPGRADASLIGQKCDDAVRLTGLLHALCPHAHRVALTRAIEAATGRRTDDRVEVMRHLVVAAEAAAAAAFRFGATWPQAFGAPIDPILPQARAYAQSVIAALESERCAKAPARALGAALATMLAADSQVQVLLSKFAPLRARTENALKGATVHDRVVAMIADAEARAAFWLAFDPTPTTLPWRKGHGNCGHADTLRGSLHVRVRVRDDRLTACEIDAPINRLTLARGPLARALHNCRDSDMARLIVLAFDPCAAMHVMQSEESEAAYA